MLFRQFFDPESGSLSYLVAPERGSVAVVVDPVRRQVPLLLRVVHALELQVLFAIDTHQHADRCSGANDLKRHLGCLSAMSEYTRVLDVDRLLADGEVLDLAGIRLEIMHTPGHTDDSCCLLLPDRVLTGDTLLIGGTGRTDHPGGDPRLQFESLFCRLLSLPGATRVYPAHYRPPRARVRNGRVERSDATARYTTIDAERRNNPCLQVASVDDYIERMQRGQRWSGEAAGALHGVLAAGALPPGEASSRAPGA